VFIAFILSRLDVVPRTVPFLHFFMLLSLMVLRRLVSRMVSRQGVDGLGVTTLPGESVIIVGCNHLTEAYIRFLDTCLVGHRRVVAIVDRRPQNHDKTILGYCVIGSPERLSDIVREYRGHGIEIDRVIVTDPELAPETGLWTGLRQVSEALGFALDYLPERLGLDSAALASRAEVAVAVQQVPALAQSGALYWYIKRLLDISGAVVLLLLLSPVIVVVAGLLAIDIGTPTIFWQQRVGRGGRPIRIYKFRTLRAPLDDAGHEIPERARISRIGHFLRRTRLDEIPQFYNILRGDMSFIGPRPLLEIDQPANAAVRLSVLPGLTGWAQVRGGKLLTPEEKNTLDEWYIRNASLKVDLRIALLTVNSILFGDRRGKNLEGSPQQYRKESAVERSAQRIGYALLPLLLSVALTACGSSDSLGPVSQADLQSLVQQAQNVSPKIQSGEKVKVTVFGEDRLSGEYEVDPAGYVSLPLAGTVKAAGLTQPELEQLLSRKFTAGYLRDPKVTVEVTAFRPFYILGEVSKPGEYPYKAGLNVLSGIALAGGTTYRAGQDAVQIQHSGESGFHDYPMSPKIPLLPGDLVKVPQRYF
jgi:lipopolysaccharide/colanic/teichoic acid biosynthesis glycosyltransferase